MVILGGMGHFWGPAVGAAVLILLNQQINAYTEYWPFILGSILIVLLFVFPGGIVGALQAGIAARCGGGAMLEVRDIRKSFNGFTAVAGVSLAVPAQGITAVIGPNGAGKSTLFNLLTGHLRADGGSVSFEGRDITGAAPHAICRMGIGRSFQHTNIFRKLTVFENVQAALIAHGGQARNFWGRAEDLYRDEALAILGSLGLADQADAISDSLSHGNQKQLELGIALASDPKLLLLDEPTAGMSATETRDAIRLLERIVAERRLTLLFTEHDMDVVFSIAQKIAVLHQGKLIAEGTPGGGAQRRARCGASISEGDNEPARSSTTSMPPMARRACCSASRSRWRRANASACSGATASARPRRCAPSWV